MTDCRKAPKAGSEPAAPAKSGNGDKRQGKGASKGGSPPAASDYEVGYGKPPRHTRFRKGQPRPPRKPRPEHEPAFQDWFEEELRLPMRFVDENGEEQVFPKGKVLAKTALNKAVKNGDLRQVMGFIPRRPERQESAVSQVDLDMIARFFEKHTLAQMAVRQPPGEEDEETDGDEDEAGAADDEGDEP